MPASATPSGARPPRPGGAAPLLRPGPAALRELRPLSPRPGRRLRRGGDRIRTSGAGGRSLELPERFLTPSRSPPPAAAAAVGGGGRAGLVALAIQAAAAANLTAGDVAIWLGGGLLADVGAQLTAGRGARTLVLGGRRRTGPPSSSLLGLGAAGAARGGAAPRARHQRSTRRLFLTRTEAATLRAASQLADAGPRSSHRAGPRPDR